jgi:hypothetical protein
MRISSLYAALVLVCLGVVGHAQDQGARDTMLMMPTTKDRVVTMSKDGTVLASVTIPPGMYVFVSVVHQGDVAPVPRDLRTGPGRWEFRGDVEVSADAPETLDRTKTLAAAMRMATIKLAGQGVDTVLTE